MTTKIKTPGITDANVTTSKLDLISTSSTPGATIKGTSGQTDGYIQLNCSENSHGIKLKAPPHSSAQNYTLTFPQSITNGYFLKTDGSGNLSFAEVNVDDTAWQASIVTAATLNAVVGYGYWIDTTSNACTITLPASPSVGDQLIFTDYARTWGTNAVTLNLNSEKFQGNTTPVPIYSTSGESVDIVYSGSTKGWIPNTDGAVANKQVYSIDYLVIAGGGSGGEQAAGGGGAGGYRTSTQTSTPGVVITVTVGDGAASVTGSSGSGNTGSSSSISGSGLTTITSAGGGYGGIYNADGGAGGSGGGGGGNTTQAGGAGNTPSTDPAQGFSGGTGNGSPQRVGGGGGGANAVGGNAGTSQAGNGGAGTASSISGPSVTRAGGGGGGSNEFAGGNGTGGAGGGGNGGHTSLNPTSGTANTGSGGGGCGSENVASGAGGKGVVILSMPTASFSGTTTGSPTEATSSGKKILTFTGSGSYTT